MMTSNNYNNYLTWKGWEFKNFATLSTIEKKYFDAEFKQLKIPFTHQVKVLEIGFGNGNFLTYAKNNGWDVSGTEISTDLIHFAKEYGFNVYHCDDLTAFAAQSYDLIVAFDVLEHIEATKIVSFLTEIKRCLKQDGLFLARFPNGDSPIGLKNQNGDITHTNVIGSEKVIQLSNICKFNLKYLKGESELILLPSITKTLYNFIVFIIKRFLNILVKSIFFRETIYIFSSANLIAVFCKEKKTGE